MLRPVHTRQFLQVTSQATNSKLHTSEWFCMKFFFTILFLLSPWTSYAKLMWMCFYFMKIALNGLPVVIYLCDMALTFSRTTCPPFLQKPLVLIGCGYVKLQISCYFLLFVFWRVYSFLWSCHLNQHSERQTWKVHYKLKERYRTGKKQKSWGSQIYMKLHGLMMMIVEIILCNISAWKVIFDEKYII